MNQEQMKQQMGVISMTRDDLSLLVGCHVKTTYWPEVPQYVITILKQAIELEYSKQVKALLNQWLNM